MAVKGPEGLNFLSLLSGILKMHVVGTKKQQTWMDSRIYSLMKKTGSTKHCAMQRAKDLSYFIEKRKEMENLVFKFFSLRQP